MKSQVWKLSLSPLLAMLLAMIMVACSGGGDYAGIGGSGYISTGTVTGFGSVFVNGVEFETDSAIFEVEDTTASQQDLRIGMVVQVSGSVNDDGVTGVATGIRYGDQLEGPVTYITGETDIISNADQTEKTFKVLGTNVIVDAVNTVFEGSGFSFDTLVLNNAVEISGYYDQNDTLRATYIKLKAAVFDVNSIVEIEGFISSLNNNSFTLRNVTVNAVAANLEDLENGLQNGIYVEVKGRYDSTTNTITATSIEAEEVSVKDDGSYVSVEGYITRYVSISDFDINGYPVNASGAQFEPAGLVLRSGIKVEAEGNIINGVLIANEIETRGGDAEIHATVATVINATSFTINVVAGEPAITVNITTATSLEDEVSEIEPFSLSNLNDNDFVEVVGFETGVSEVTATKIKRKSPDDVILQGMATDANGNATSGDITVLGVKFNFNGSTSFESESDESLGSGEIDDLIATIQSTPTLVKIKDEVVADGTAEEIDMED